VGRDEVGFGTTTSKGLSCQGSSVSRGLGGVLLNEALGLKNCSGDRDPALESLVFGTREVAALVVSNNQSSRDFNLSTYDSFFERAFLVLTTC